MNGNAYTRPPIGERFGIEFGKPIGQSFDPTMTFGEPIGKRFDINFGEPIGQRFGIYPNAPSKSNQSGYPVVNVAGEGNNQLWNPLLPDAPGFDANGIFHPGLPMSPGSGGPPDPSLPIPTDPTAQSQGLNFSNVPVPGTESSPQPPPGQTGGLQFGQDQTSSFSPQSLMPNMLSPVTGYNMFQPSSLSTNWQTLFPY